MRIFEECAKYNQCSVFKVIRHRLYKHTFKIYDSVLLRVYLNILHNCVYFIPLFNKYTTELIHEWPDPYPDPLEVGRCVHVGIKSGKECYFASINAAGRQRLPVFLLGVPVYKILCAVGQAHGA